MSIIGNWFKKEAKQRLETQQGAAGDVEIEKNESSEAAVKTKKTVAKTKVENKKDSEKDTVEPVVMSPILLRPHITEKAADNQARGVYTFVVSQGASKNEIAKAINRTYKVQPDKIRVLNMRGKTVRWGRHRGQRNHWRKALVYLKKGDTMIIHEGT